MSYEKITGVDARWLVEQFERGVDPRVVAEKSHLARFTVFRFYKKYRKHGKDSLMQRKSVRIYPQEIKTVAVYRYLQGESPRVIADDLDIGTPGTVYHWANQAKKDGYQALSNSVGRPLSLPGIPEGLSVKELKNACARSLAVADYKKAAGHHTALNNSEKTEIVDSLRAKHRLADLLYAADLAESSYYYNRQKLQRPDPDAGLKDLIKDIWLSSRKTYGRERIRLALDSMGILVNRKKIYRLMTAMDIRAEIRVPRRRHFNGGSELQSAPNLLNRMFRQEQPNKVWCADITEFNVNGTRVYLSAVIDLCDRSIVAHNISLISNVRLTRETILKGLETHNPAGGLLVHTDQGYHYRHPSWYGSIKKEGHTVSMSRKGNCHDNAVIENFFSHLKSEIFYKKGAYTNVKELIATIEGYISWYNHERINTSINGQTPMQYRINKLQEIAA